MTHRRIYPQPETERASVAAQIVGKQRHGIIDGVQVDFRHDELPASEWTANPHWDFWGPPPSCAGIVFPAEAGMDLKAILRAKGFSTEELASAVYVRAGDKITIASVVPQVVDGRFDHPHDTQKRLAYLRIERPSGEVVENVGPLEFYGVTRIKNAPLAEAFDHIAHRLCRHAGLPDLHATDWQSYTPGPWEDASVAEVALWEAQMAHDTYFQLLAKLPDDAAETGAGNAKFQLRTIINAAAMAGFLLAKHEARKAERAGGAVLANLEKATEAVLRVDWREKAERLWEENPQWTVNRVANAIAAGTDDDPRSIARAIKKQMPKTSRSYKGE